MGQSVDHIFLNVLKSRFFIKEEKDRAIYSVKVGIDKEFSDSYPVKFLLSLLLESELSDGLNLLGVNKVEKGSDGEDILGENQVFNDVMTVNLVLLFLHCFRL